MMRGWKVALIEDAQLMNDAASNALLKSLEEPHPKTILLLLADDAENVMPTIRSRCQVVRFPRVAISEVRDGLMARGVAEGDADLYARLSAGRPGLALRFAEHPEELDAMRAMRDAILDMHGQTVAERWKALGGFLPAKASFIELGIAAGTFLDLAAELLRDVMLLQQDAEASLAHADVRARTVRWATQAGVNRTEAALHALAEAQEHISRNVNPRAVLEQFTLAL
jgi:DNA polymerase-3 subunit delta'